MRRVASRSGALLWRGLWGTRTAEDDIRILVSEPVADGFFNTRLKTVSVFLASSRDTTDHGIVDCALCLVVHLTLDGVGLEEGSEGAVVCLCVARLKAVNTDMHE